MRNASVFPSSSNDNTALQVRAVAAAALIDVRDLEFPYRRPSAGSDAFARFRVAILADHEVVLSTKRRNGRLHAETIRCALRLAQTRSTTRLDFAAKVIAFRAFTSAARAYAAGANDPAALIRDADAISDLLAAIAADMVGGSRGGAL